MLTRRGWWFLLVVLSVLAASIGTSTPGASVIALTLLLWFLFLVVVFRIQTIQVHGRLRIVREIADELGPVSSLWVGRTFKARVQLLSDAALALPYVQVEERTPFGVDCEASPARTEGTLSKSTPLEISYRFHCAAPGRVRFEGLTVRIADIQGLFYSKMFVQEVTLLRVLPALADAKGQFPTPKRHNLLPLSGAHRHRRPGTGSELLDLRDYRPGDAPKMIAWKPSARRGRLMTKEFESEVPIRCTLFVDTSNSVRVGLPGQNALARLVEIVAAVAQANAAVRDLTGLCLFNEREDDTTFVRPARGSRHVVEVYGLLADVVGLAPTTAAVEPKQILPVAYGLAEEVYPHLLDGAVNRYPWWLPLWDPQSAATLRRRPIPRGAWLRRLRQALAYEADFFWQNLIARLNPAEWKRLRWRKKLAAILAMRSGLGAPVLAELLEDDGRFVLELQRFLIEHQVPFELPLYGPDGRYLFAAPEKIEVLAGALRGAVGRGRDNELFVLLVDLLEQSDRLDPLLATVRMAVARRHHVLVVCPWPPGVPVPGRSEREKQKREAEFKTALGELIAGNRSPQVLQLILQHTTTLRLHRAYDEIHRALGRIGVQVLCAAHGDSPQLILNRMEKLRVLERGVR
jgi:uncharacterized protein (DUF58 family)